MIFYFLTEGGNPLRLTKIFNDGKAHYEVEINLKPLVDHRTTSDSILFTDLIKRMIREDPDDRETCEKLIKHAVFMNEGEQCKIVEKVAYKCHALKNKFPNSFFIKILNKDELHLEGFLGEDTEAWKNFESIRSKFPELQIDIKTCSSLLRMFDFMVISIGNFVFIIIKLLFSFHFTFSIGEILR